MPPAATQLPVLKPGGIIQGATVAPPSQNQLVVTQTQPNAIIDWSSFTIGANAGVQFNQGQWTPSGTTPGANIWTPQPSYAVLNRIWDSSPSLIFGKITADGRVFLINQNGILFGPGSQVNVNGLVASALNIKNTDFLSGTMNFYQETGLLSTVDLDSSGNRYSYNGISYNPNAAVSNYGEIDAAQQGNVFLIGPRVENGGLITAPLGQIGLVAATNVTLIPPPSTDPSRSGYYVIINPDIYNNPKNPSDPTFGEAVNQVGGNMYADGGMVGMYGNNVNQWGVIRSMTAYQNMQGQVELRAANSITTGANSSIILPVNPSTTETVSDTFNIQPIVNIGGLSALDTTGTPIAGLGPNPAGSIVLQGSIVAPTGIVNLNANNRVYMETGSTIDVSGVVATLPSPVITAFELNSIELRDDYVQKGGVLQAADITTTVVAGSSIGDLSQAILTMDRTALARCVGGAMTQNQNADGSYSIQTGQINVTVANGDIIVKPGANLNISGGVINYVGGLVNTTKLVSGTNIYDISDAPASIQYDQVLGQYEKAYNGFGMAQSYTGLYYGGASSLKTYVNGYTQGGDAGEVTLTASSVVMAGTLHGGVTTGVYQTQNTWTTSGITSAATALSVDSGLEAPRAGTLTIGNTMQQAPQITNPTQQTTAISIVSDTSYQAQSQQFQFQNLQPDSPLQAGTTLLSAKTLNDADLGTINLYANLTISMDPDVSLNLQPGGTFSASARRVDVEGGIKVPQGTINLLAVQNITSYEDQNGNAQTTYVPLPQNLPERIVLGPASSLDVSGERTNGETGIASTGPGWTGGGNINLLDETDLGSGVFIMAGAVVDVSGGYIVNQKGNVTGGNAGVLTIQGLNIMLNGDLMGYALAGTTGDIQGGSINLSSKNIIVGNAAQDWSGFNPYNDAGPGQLILAGDRFDDTGFTQITLNSLNSIVIGAAIAPSLVRLNNPTGTSTPGQPVTGQPGLILLDGSMASLAGPSSFTANAGSPFLGYNPDLKGNLTVPPNNADINITLSPGAVVSTAPAASSATNISLNAPSVDLEGELLSPGGNITVKAAVGNLTVGPTAQINAAGYNLPVPTSLTGNSQPVTGGRVTLSAPLGELTLAAGSTIDISGSGVVTNSVMSGGKVTTYTTAGYPGSLSLTYYGLNWNGGLVNASAQMGGIQGGALTISKTDPYNGLDVTATVGDITSYTAGVDVLGLKSQNSLVFNDTLDLALGRQLTLDAPLIQENGQSSVTFTAPWIILANSSSTAPSSQPPSASVPTGGSFTLSGQWIDVIGSTQFSGFQNVALVAVRDISLSEVLYNTPGGQLATTGNLIMDADRIYPGNLYKNNGAGGNTIYPDIYSDYTLYANGTVTVQHTSPSVGGPIYSAGGTLTVEGLGGIDLENGGCLAAPLGTITLEAPNSRIFLDAGSVLTTAGNTPVLYGLINSNNQWVVEDQTNPNGADAGTSLPFDNSTFSNKGVTLQAAESIVMKGSLIDITGGGSVFAYQFQPGISGSVDPLTKPGRYVVIQYNSFQMPGAEVYLLGGGGLSAGYYTLLPLDANDPQNARYAFMPGAYILQLQTTGASLQAQGSLSQDGYPVTVGYSAVANTSILSSQPQVYSVQTAASVLATEGTYVQPSFVSGDGGSLNIQGNTTIINGTINAASAPGYKGASVALAATNIIVQSSAAAQLDNFGFTTGLNQDLIGNLTISADSISGKGFQDITLGNTANTQTVTIGTANNPVVLAADSINLAAGQNITIWNNSQLQALTGEGAINLTTPGSLLVNNGAVIHASNNITVKANDVQGFQGALQVENGAITLQSNAIIFGGNSGKLPADVGLYLTSDIWNNITGYQNITLAGNSDIEFRTDFAGQLSSGNSLTLDAPLIQGDGSSVTLQATTVNLRNSGPSSTAVTPVNGGTFTVNAAGGINVGSGDVLFGGFNSIALISKGDMTLIGKGSLTTGNADLSINAPRVTTASTTAAVTNPDGTDSSPVTAANFVVYTGSNYYNDQNNLNPTNAITISSSGGAPGQTNTPGGMLQFLGSTINVNGGIIQVDSGTIKLVAAGSEQTDGIFLKGGQILARGTDDAPGGQITVSALNGSLGVDSTSLIDVSAGTQGDAGAVTLLAPVGGVSMLGTLSGKANGGVGGSFALDTNRISDFSSLNSMLATGGFTESINIRTETGDLDITSGSTVQAYNVTLNARGGIDVSGTIDASAYAGQATGGTVGLYANNDINIQSGGRIAANAATGGYVLLNSEQGLVNVSSGGTIDVSGGTGGTVYLRAQQNGNGSAVNIKLNGAIAGAAAVYVEAFKTYNYATSNDYTQWMTDAATYYTANANTAIARLGGAVPAGTFHFLPGIEVDSAGDINWDTALTNFSSQAGVPALGALTLRAAGDLNINSNLVDAPTTNLTSLPSSTVRDSWAFNLVAGADLSSANYMSVNRSGSGDLNVAPNTIVYTESAPINFASGRNTVIGSMPSAAPGYMINNTMSYNLASFSGNIQGYVGQDLILNGGVVQTATGNIDITVGRDLNFGSGSGTLGAIRTTGQAPAAVPQDQPTTGNVATDYWIYSGGGDINLDVGRYSGTLNSGGQLVTAEDPGEWDYFTALLVPGVTNENVKNLNDRLSQFSANYTKGTGGIATMGGGSVTVHTGADFLVQSGTFGLGNLTIFAGGNISGRFLNANGQGEINAMGNFGSYDERQQIELLNSQMTVTALGDIQLGAVLNPSLASDQVFASSNYFVDCTYTQNTSITLKAGGNVTIAGTSPVYKNNNVVTSTSETVMPASVNVAAGGNIYLLNNLTLTSSPAGQLSLVAGGDINGNNVNTPPTLLMSDIAPAYWYGLFSVANSADDTGGHWISNMTQNYHGYFKPSDAALEATLQNPVAQSTDIPTHLGDSKAVKISAGGDIENLNFDLPKVADLTAGGDILNITYQGQNIGTSDVSQIVATGNITMRYSLASSQSTSSSEDLQPTDGLIQGGPGAFLVQAGGSIDLGTMADGIQTIGNGANTALGTGVSNLIVVSGYTLNAFNPSLTQLSNFFDSIKTAGDQYATMLADGNSAEAATLLQTTRQGTIVPFLGTPSGAGDIDMTSSQISTSIGQSNVYIISAGNLNVGQSALPAAGTTNTKTGITTGGGGAINIYANEAVNEAVNVNQSRIMTFYGGDITVWSDYGNINAGRGSSTAVSASPPHKQTINGVTTTVFVPPAIGSGIRAVTYGFNPPPPGDIHLFAPNGVIDAGEAGISGSEVILAAVHVVNSVNIFSSGSSIGVPVATTATVGLGALSGQGAVASQNSQMLSDVAGINAASESQASQMIDNIMAKWLDVKVVDFVEEQ
jgi:filamentous hemagglutinin family protein